MPVILKGQFPRSSGWAEFTIENKWLTEKANFTHSNQTPATGIKE